MATKTASETLFVCRNTRRLPVAEGNPHAGEIRPYLTRRIDDDPERWGAAAFTEQDAADLSSWGEWVPAEEAVAEGFEIVPSGSASDG